MPSKSRYISSLGLRYTLGKTIVLSGLLAVLVANPAAADEAADVSKLLRSGQYAEAIGKADAFLAQRPRDAQMRFLKGVILTEQNKSAEAVTVFTKLTEDFPDLPEPYNNLAVLYAAAGQYEKARAALDKAIRTNPAYATAYENLGDVHAKLASQAYDKALQLDSGNSGAKSKLTLVRSLVPGTNGSKVVAMADSMSKTKPAPAASAEASANPKAAAVPATPAPSAPAAAKPGPAAVAKTESAKAEPKQASKPAPATTAKAEPARIDPPKPVKPAPNSNPDHEMVLAAVNGWAKAWSAKDVKGYLSFYANDFETPNHLSRKAWTDERHSRIAGKGRINVKVESPQVTVNGNTATVKFRQTYLSDRLTASSRKTLVLTRHGARWQIQQERTGS
ncbi:MAG: tetratricopeptide repeat protein [Herminiimonas sp.]|nr:tetratricopeptide repeat protein [Herminiimonas sp.]